MSRCVATTQCGGVGTVSAPGCAFFVMPMSVPRDQTDAAEWYAANHCNGPDSDPPTVASVIVAANRRR